MWKEDTLTEITAKDGTCLGGGKLKVPKEREAGLLTRPGGAEQTAVTILRKSSVISAKSLSVSLKPWIIICKTGIEGGPPYTAVTISLSFFVQSFTGAKYIIL